MYMNNTLIRPSTWQVVVLTYAGLIFFQPLCLYTYYAARRDMNTAYTYEDWKLLRTMRRCSMVGIVLFVCVWVIPLLFFIWALNFA